MSLFFGKQNLHLGLLAKGRFNVCSAKVDGLNRRNYMANNLQKAIANV